MYTSNTLKAKIASGTIGDMRKPYVVASFIISALLVPVLASAATADEIQAQIQSLLSQVTALQLQLTTLTSNTSIATSTNVSCPNLYRALSRGSRGSDVISLQQFFIAQGLLSNDSATGFFGTLTEGAVQKWQAQNSIVANGDAASTGYGVIGPLTRAAIATHCGTPSVQSCPLYQIPICSAGQHIEYDTADLKGCVGAPRCVNSNVSCPTYNACPTGYTTTTFVNSNGCTVQQCVPPTVGASLNATPTSGVAPLTISFTGNTGSSSYFGGVQINFGDGQTEVFCDFGSECGMNSKSHTYTSAGTYDAKLVGVGEGSSSNLVTATVTVSVPQTTTFSATPKSGAGPLNVTFTISGQGNYRLDFGDGQTVGPAICMEGSFCSPYTIDHTYNAGNFTATLTKPSDNSVVGSINIVVGGCSTDPNTGVTSCVTF